MEDLKVELEETEEKCEEFRKVIREMQAESDEKNKTIDKIQKESDEKIQQYIDYIAQLKAHFGYVDPEEEKRSHKRHQRW